MTTVLRTLQFTETRSTDRLSTNYWRALVTSPKFFASSVKLLHFSLRIVSNRSENITGSGPGKECPSSSIRFSECFYHTFIMGRQLPTLHRPVLKNALHINVHKRKNENVPACKNNAVKTYGALIGDLHALTFALDRSEKSSR